MVSSKLAGGTTWLVFSRQGLEREGREGDEVEFPATHLGGMNRGVRQEQRFPTLCMGNTYVYVPPEIFESYDMW